MTVTWTAVFELTGMTDTPEEIGQSVNGFAGAALQRALRPALTRAGWTFCEAFPEDFGWWSDAPCDDQGKPAPVSLVIAPEGDTRPDGGAEADRWRVVIGRDLGLFPGTKTRRTETFRGLARDVRTACEALGAKAFEWEVGGPI